MSAPPEFTDVAVKGDPTSRANTRPSLRFMLARPEHLIALGFGSGLSPVAPGTAGTLWAWLSFVLLGWGMSDWQWALIIIGSTLLGWWACTVTAQHMGQSDSSHMVADEIVAFWLILWVIQPSSFASQLLAFAVFRFFDAVKFGPTAWADRAFKGFGWRGGWGVMLDDLVAALLTLLTLAIVERLWT